VSTNDGKLLNGLLGASYLRDKAHFDAMIYGASPFSDLFAAFGEFPNTYNALDTKSASVFLEGYLTPVEHLKITLGGRYTHDSRDFNVTDNFAGTVIGGGAPGTLINQSASTSSNAFTPRVVVAYDLTPVNLYVSFNRGYKSGGFSEPDFSIIPEYTVKPEFIKSYEVGAKFVSDDRRLRANAAAFYYSYTDIQVSYYASINGVATPLTENAASAKANGLELDGSFAVTPQLDLTAGGNYLHAYFTSYPQATIVLPAPATPCAGPASAACPYPGAVSGSGIPGALGSYTANLAGSPLTRSPKYTYYVGGTLKQPIGNDWQASLSAVLRHSADFDFYPGRGGPLGLDYQPAYTLMNLTANVGPSDGRYAVGLYVNNVTNAEYYVTHQTTSPFGIATAPAPPRTYGARVTVKF
jgi:iron complex outermembrane receptor protein